MTSKPYHHPLCPCASAFAQIPSVRAVCKCEGVTEEEFKAAVKLSTILKHRRAAGDECRAHRRDCHGRHSSNEIRIRSDRPRL
jgi:hypothetical protein